jgi:hypothetical protein
MDLFSILFITVLGITVISSLYFLIKIIRIMWRHKRYWPFSKKPLPPEERFAISKYRIRLFICFFSGLGVSALLIALDYGAYKNKIFTGLIRDMGW